MSIDQVTRTIIGLLEKSWGVFLLALCVRVVIVVLGYDGGPQDTPEYDEIAHNLLDGQGFVASNWWHGFEVRSWRPPFYPLFLASLYGSVGYSHSAVRLCQCVIGALTAMVVMMLGKKLDPRIAPFCGILAAFYGPLASISNEVMTETWFTFWGVVSVFFLVSGQIGKSGIVLGLGILTRPVGAFYLVALGVMVAIRRGNWPRRLWAVGIALLVVLPWTIRNYAVHDVWPILSSQGGFIVARSNAVEPDWRKPHGWGVSKEFLKKMPSEIARDRYWWREARSFVIENPGAYLKLVAERFLRFWYFFHPWYNIWFMTVLPLFVFGFLHFWRSRDYLLPALYILVSFLVLITLLYANSRFRLPLMPFFLIFASAGIRHMLDVYGLRVTGSVVFGLAGINCLIGWQAQGLRDVLLFVLNAAGLR